MHIDERKITVREITENYFNDAEEGVVGYDEQLDIRPKYQREFVYKDEQRNEVIRTVMKGLPLNVMYWVDRGEEFGDNPDTPRYEVMDGQQLTDQELRNAVYAGSWTSDAICYFSKSGCAADRLAGDYLNGSSIRQEYLETAILWAASAERKTIEGYMSEHQHNPSAVTLWNFGVCDSAILS